MDIFEPILSEAKNSENFCKTRHPNGIGSKACCLGIDEAGRGPVLGPMVYACCYYPLDDEEMVKKLGVADSKTLTEDSREQLFQLINDNANIGWCANVIQPSFISKCMLARTKTSLNEVSHQAAMGLIQNALDSYVNVTNIYVDTVGPPEAYQKKIEMRFPSPTVAVSKQADSKFPCVSAASIVAKVIRDRILHNWTLKEAHLCEKNLQYGSGYPGDPTTKAFLQESVDRIFGYPDIVRFSWSTIDNVLQQNGVRFRWIDDDQDSAKRDAAAVGCSDNIKRFFQRKPDDIVTEFVKACRAKFVPH